MKNRSLFVLIILFILLAVYNILVFVLPIPITPGFWPAYIFATLAFILQFGISIAAFQQDVTRKSAFLGLPIINIGVFYLVMQITWGFVAMLIPLISAAISTVVSVILLGACLVSIIFTRESRDYITNTDRKVGEKVNHVKTNLVKLEMLISKTENAGLKKSLTALKDLVR